jgi:hypothetical protein
MRLLNFANFELPAVFAKLNLRGGPPVSSPGETRHVDDLINYPNIGFHDPNSLHFPQAQRPIVPGHGGQITMGLGMVEYSGQPQWDRSAVCQAGPIKAFFQGVLFDNRVKHI